MHQANIADINLPSDQPIDCLDYQFWRIYPNLFISGHKTDYTDTVVMACADCIIDQTPYLQNVVRDLVAYRELVVIPRANTASGVVEFVHLSLWSRGSPEAPLYEDSGYPWDKTPLCTIF